MGFPSGKNGLKMKGSPTRFEMLRPFGRPDRLVIRGSSRSLTQQPLEDMLAV